MSIQKEINFDLIMAGEPAQNINALIDTLAKNITPLCTSTEENLQKLFYKSFVTRLFSINDGVFIFDMKTIQINRPILGLITLSSPMDMPQLQNAHAFIIVLSPRSCGSQHLKRLSYISRIMRNNDLCTAIHGAQDQDAVRALFLPNHDWMLAA